MSGKRTSSPELKWRLPRGASGFWDRGRAPLAQVAPESFAAVCHQVARSTGGKVVQAALPGVSSYFRAGLSRPGRQVDLLCHRHLPLLAAAEPSAAGAAEVIFVEDVGLRDALSGMERFRLLAVAELAMALSSLDLSELDGAELKQIAYWRPETAGQVLFNAWD